MSRPKKWVNPVESRIKNGSKKKEFTPSKDALDAFPFPVERDSPLGSQDSTKQLGEVAATADNLTDGYDFSLIDNPMESPEVEQISVEGAGPVGAQASSEQVSTGPIETSTDGFDFSPIDNPEEDPNVGLFTVKSANQVIMEARNKPVPKFLFGQLWHEGENCILFSDTNTGKSVLAVQIADAISSGRRDTLGLAMDAYAQKVAYFDFELSDVQFRKRYSDVNGNDYQFSPNLLNITFFGNDLEKGSEALHLMKWLKGLKDKYGLSILILAHTPKRDQSKPYTLNDLAGSRKQSIAADSVFAIGVSAKDPKVRYIKELKQRDEEYRYLADNVIVCEIEKPNNFLQFSFRGYGSERDHLTATQRDEEVKRAKELKSQGKTQREIVALMGVSLGKVNNLLKK